MTEGHKNAVTLQLAWRKTRMTVIIEGENWEQLMREIERRTRTLRNGGNRPVAKCWALAEKG